MIGRAAADEKDLPKTADILLGQAGIFQRKPPVLQQRAQSTLHGLRLLVDLFHHEVLIAALFRGFRVPQDFHRLLFDFVPVQVVEGNALGAEPGQFQVAHIINGAGVFQNGRHIRGKKLLAVSGADDHGAVLPGGVDFAGIVLEEHSQSIGAANTNHGMVDGIHRSVGIFFIVVVDEFEGYLRVRGGIEGIAVSQELLSKLLVVFNDAVVNAHHVAVIGAVGMGILLRGFSMGGPAGMADAAGH